MPLLKASWTNVASVVMLAIRPIIAAGSAILRNLQFHEASLRDNLPQMHEWGNFQSCRPASFSVFD